MRYLYTVLMYLLMPFILMRLLWRSVRAPAYAKRWNERFGFFKAPSQAGGIWVHAVSMGETMAAIPLIKRLQEAYPQRTIIVTTMTPTGSMQVHKQLGNSVFHVYAPYDLPCAWQRFFKRVTPCTLIVMETELWPNLLHAAHQHGVPVVVANARLSERSARGYAKVAAVTRKMLTQISHVCAQYESDGERFVALGLAPNKLSIIGNIKFDTDIKPDLLERARALKNTFGENRAVFIAASTHEGEEEKVLAACAHVWEKFPTLLLIIVPRHPERFGKVVELLRNKNLHIAVRSKNEKVLPATQVLVADTMGELLLLFGAADIAFVGGSLVAHGGHNMLEPISVGLPTISGPHVFNFSRISEMLLSKKALIHVTNEAQLADAVMSLLEQPSQVTQMKAAGAEVIAQNKGALDRLWAAVQRFMPVS